MLLHMHPQGLKNAHAEATPVDGTQSSFFCMSVMVLTFTNTLHDCVCLKMVDRHRSMTGLPYPASVSLW